MIATQRGKPRSYKDEKACHTASLQQQAIHCAIYESREEALSFGEALMLAPNGLKVLHTLGLYDHLKTRGYSFDRIYVQDAASKRILETIEYGNLDRYGVRALRTYRYILLGQLLEAVTKQGIPIHFGHAYDHVVAKTGDRATWRFKDGSTASASLLIGADGIHSIVREYLFPGLKPEFNGAAAIIAAVPTAQLGLSAHDIQDLNAAENGWPLPSGIIIPGLGSIVIAPQTNTGDEVLVTVQRRLSEAEEAHWASVDADKDHLRALLRENADQFPSIIQNSVHDTLDDQLFIWPSTLFLASSAGLRTPFPPNSGQGVNQAFEDAYIFAGLLARLRVSGAETAPSNNETLALQKALQAWQTFRQERIVHVLELNKQMDLWRMPKAPGAPPSGAVQVDMEVMFSRLFNIDFGKVIDQCATHANGNV